MDFGGGLASAKGRGRLSDDDWLKKTFWLVAGSDLSKFVLCSGCSTAVECTPSNREAAGLIHAGSWAFFLSILSGVFLNRSLEEVQHYCFSF